MIVLREIDGLILRSNRLLPRVAIATVKSLLHGAQTLRYELREVRP